MKRILVWDLPVRLFHWTLVGSFVAAFLIAGSVDDESPIFIVHMLLGAVVAFMVFLRLIWGLSGSKWARFSSFTVRELKTYLRSTVTGGEKRYTGHNPGSSLAALVMYVCSLGLAVTGVLMTRGAGEAFGEVHGLFALTMVLAIGIHLTGIIWFSFRNHENIAMTMISGRKTADPADAIESARPAAGLAFLILTGLWAFVLFNGFDRTNGTVTLPVVGQVLEAAPSDDQGYEQIDRGDDED